MPKMLNYRYIMTGTLLTYSLFFFLIARNQEKTKLSVSLSRRISRMTGRIMSIPLPPYFRAMMYRAFGRVYGVNFDEIKVDDINKFSNFNQFFTREIKDEARVIDAPQDPQTLASPCDGKVLSFGTVDAETYTMECIKGNAYRVDEFLFGFKTKMDD